MLARVLEPEVMDTEAEALEYDGMDFQTINRDFALTAADLRGAKASVLDLGTGTARIPILLAEFRPDWHITAVDLARSMLAIAAQNVVTAQKESQICLEFVDVKHLPYADGSFDGVISNSLLHHLPNPLSCLKEIKRVLKPNGFLLLRDLIRPPTLEQLQQIVMAVDEDYSSHQRQLFFESLHAAFTLSEMHDLLKILALEPMPHLYQSSDRHWTIKRAATIPS